MATATWGSPNVYELTGSRTETYTRKEMTAKVTLISPWNSRSAEIMKITATRYPLTTEASQYYFPSFPKTVEVSVWEEKGSASDIHAVTYTQAKLDVSYQCWARAAANLEESFTQTCTPIIQMRRLPSFGFYWATDGSPVLDEESPAMLAIQMKITRQITGIQTLPSWFWSLAGCVNDAPWNDFITKNVYNAGTLLYIPASAVKQLTANPDDIDNVWDISFDLMWNPIG